MQLSFCQQFYHAPANYMNQFSYKHGQLNSEQVPLAAIAAKMGTPFYIYSQEELSQRANAYLSAIPLNALVCYAVKANGNPAIIQLLGQAGLGADVTSGGELFLALHAGIDPAKIIFSGVGKTEQEIEEALQAGIRALHVESEMELDVVARVACGIEKVAPIGVRINPNINAETHPYISTGLHGHKFGVPMDQAISLLHRAAAYPFLEPVGLAAHIGSQITKVNPYIEAAEFLAGTALSLAANGIRLRYLDIGGGLGIDYTNEGVPTIEQWAEAVSDPITRAGFEMVMEPGRSIVGPAGALITRVLYTKKQGEKSFLITDAGMTELIRPTLYDGHHPILPVKRPHPPGFALYQYDVVGPVCETSDFLAKERPLPKIEAGDLLAILQAGAYGFAMSSNYNGRLRPAEILVEGDTYRTIRQRQTYIKLLDGVTNDILS